MMKYVSLSLIVTIMAVGNATAQVTTGDSSAKGAPGFRKKFILTEISSMGVDTFNASGVKLRGNRHEMGALYQPMSLCSGDQNLACVQAIPPAPRSTTLIFREWELANTPIKARIFNICRRTIERSQPGSRVVMEGRVTETPTGDRVFVRDITSCTVETSRQ